MSGRDGTSSFTRPHAPRRIRAGQALLWFIAVAAAVAAILAMPSVATADDDTKVLHAWHAYGLVVFAGLFALLARYPHAYRGVWELVIFHKVALTVTALIYLAQDSATGTSVIIASDGTLVVVLLTAYVLCRGWKAAPGRASLPPPHT